MTTSFGGMVRTWDKGISGVSASYHGDTLALAMADAIRTASYYAVGLGYAVEIGECRESCETCHGSGTVRSARKFKRCPDCKGKTFAACVPPFPFMVHPQSYGMRLFSEKVSAQ